MIVTIIVNMMIRILLINLFRFQMGFLDGADGGQFPATMRSELIGVLPSTMIIH